jgi:hypothetical protein
LVIFGHQDLYGEEITAMLLRKTLGYTVLVFDGLHNVGLDSGLFDKVTLRA